MKSMQTSLCVIDIDNLLQLLFYRKETLLQKTSPHKAVGDIHVNVEVCDCTTIATLNSHVLLWGNEGWAGTIPTKFLLVGLTVRCS